MNLAKVTRRPATNADFAFGWFDGVVWTCNSFIPIAFRGGQEFQLARVQYCFWVVQPATRDRALEEKTWKKHIAIRQLEHGYSKVTCSLVEKSPDGSRCRAQAIINLFDCNNPDMAVATWIFPPVAATDVLGRMWKLHMSIQWRTHLHFIMFMCNMCIIYIHICVYMIISIYLYTHVHSHTYEMHLCQQSRQQLWGIGGLVYIYIYIPVPISSTEWETLCPISGLFSR